MTEVSQILVVQLLLQYRGTYKIFTIKRKCLCSDCFCASVKTEINLQLSCFLLSRGNPTSKSIPGKQNSS